ncbi:polysaccharide pyruvyl transferase family protein [Geofilum rubicundum]|uniref:Polysaccharide pyruvyl transferase domain-containing protein n=1 Tax=Geofilum rubicundum JCM 15548 TaxID=1236989 RepID=A0A0E9M1P4_9BACT|nr:polysaccharide pyruvyl transferase family protein [Geofilum rubicundum]GAO31483.1 hypothetical protein JCM15548_13847 [Geofilum rubicundum JCM 15548]
MKRIGILTYFTDIPYFNDVNPGMNLQAYSVLKALSNQYPNSQVEFIRYHSWWAEWRPYISGMTFDSLLQDIKQFWKYYRFSSKFPRSKRALVTKSRNKAFKFFNSLNYDAIYVGSDTLLELFRFDSNEVSPYWLNGEVIGKKFLLAASARETSIGGLSLNQIRLLKESVLSFDRLGVRDASTFSLVQNFLPQDDPRLEIVPDPTFSLEIDYAPAQVYLKKRQIQELEKPIVCFHLVKTNLFAHQLADVFRKDGYMVVSLRPAPYADIVLKDLSPLEFAGIFKYFDFVITHRFHDSVFCLKNLCPFLLFLPSPSYSNENGDSKQSFLMESFGLKDENFIEDINVLSPLEIREYAKRATLNFEAKKQIIEQKLHDLGDDFCNYLKITASLID